ncbi:MAG: lectin [Gammaproteobacteria bacterium]
MQTVISTIVFSFLVASGAPAQQGQMSFFVTSVGSGNGANLGGLAGADKQCQTLAAAVGAGNRTWRAYLSTQGPNAVNARERIGQGPWVNAKGVQIAANVAELHGPKNNLTGETALTEKGGSPTRHDMLTGSQMNGMAFTDTMDHTCGNWTSSTTGSASLGHYDRRGLSDTEQARSWNSSHPSKGCSQENLRSTGGDGLFYCFATN